MGWVGLELHFSQGYSFSVLMDLNIALFLFSFMMFVQHCMTHVTMASNHGAQSIDSEGLGSFPSHANMSLVLVMGLPMSEV